MLHKLFESAGVSTVIQYIIFELNFNRLWWQIDDDDNDNGNDDDDDDNDDDDNDDDEDDDDNYDDDDDDDNDDDDDDDGDDDDKCPVCNGVLGRMWHLHPTASPLSPKSTVVFHQRLQCFTNLYLTIATLHSDTADVHHQYTVHVNCIELVSNC